MMVVNSVSDFDWVKKSKEEWDSRASFWNKKSQGMWENGSRKDIIPFLDRHLGKQTKVLDVGCGDGYGTSKLHKLGHRVTGIDISDEMIAKARASTENIPFLTADVSKIPMEDESFGAVMSINVLEWVEVPELALRELKRVLKPNGILCIGILGPTAGPRASGYPKVYGKQTICNNMMPWEFFKLAKELELEFIDEFGVYKEGVTEKNYQDLSIILKQSLSFMWVFLLRKVGDNNA